MAVRAGRAGSRAGAGRRDRTAVPTRPGSATSSSSDRRGPGRRRWSRRCSRTPPRSPGRAPSSTAPRCATTTRPRSASSGRSRWPSPRSARGHQDQPDRHPRLRRLRRRAARRAARRRRRAVRRRPPPQGREGAIDPATVAQWEECAAVGMPRAVVVARCDHARADLEATIAACQEAFGAGVAPLYLPIRDGEAHDRAVRPALPDPRGRRRPTTPRTPAARSSRGSSSSPRTRRSWSATSRARTSRSPRSSTTWRPRSPAAPSTRSSRSARASGVGLDALLEVLVGGFPSPLEHPLPAVSRRRRLARTRR